MTTALYRRYRPDTFDDVIGQKHVTEPLKAALRSNRITHAYLFSGPRGCGKTTSARILARCLNCAEGPTDTPCGKCESCVELASGGPGSLDVVEIDAASHNGVDDARELRERASFAPVRDRFKVFILDEAHMVTPQGFNALLKLVEEPPEHVKFIFATTEPERVIGTIRSRTHHYPFRLVPGDVLEPYLAKLCDAEGIDIGEGVLPLVIRAGGGSVRDSLSVLDQLMAGSIDHKIPYDLAIALLGYTDTSLLDRAVEQLADRDGAGIFETIEQMVESGHDPRRFVEDFLQRLRDLLIISVAGERASDILSELPADQRERMFAQAEKWGAAALSTAAEITDESLRTMVGATSPRLQLELMVGRILVELSGARRDFGSATSNVQDAGGAPIEVVAPAPQIMGEDGKPLTGAALAREELRRARGQEETRGDQRQSSDAHRQQTSDSHQASDAREASDGRGRAGAEAQKPTELGGFEPPSPVAQAVESEGMANRSGVDRGARSESEHSEGGNPVPQQGQDVRGHGGSGEQLRGEPRVVSPVGQQSPRSESGAHDNRSGSAETHQTSQQQSAKPGANSTVNLHGKWDQFIDAVRAIMPSSAFLIGSHAKIVSEDSDSVTFAFPNQGLANVFLGKHQDTAAKAIQIVTGVAKTPKVQVGGEPIGAEPQNAGSPQNRGAGAEQNPRGAQGQHGAQNQHGSQNQQNSQQHGGQWGSGPRNSSATSHASGVQEGGANPTNRSANARSGETPNGGAQSGNGSPLASSAPSATQTPQNAWPEVRPIPNGHSENHANSEAANEPQSRTEEPAAASRNPVAHDDPARSERDSVSAGNAPVSPSAIEHRVTPDESDQHAGPTLAYSQPATPPEQPVRTAATSAPSSPAPAYPEPDFPPDPPEPPEEDYYYDPAYDETGGARLDDADASNSNLVGLPLVEKMFGAKIIEDTSKGSN